MLALFARLLIVLGAGTRMFYSPVSALVNRLYDTQGSAIGVLAVAVCCVGRLVLLDLNRLFGLDL